MIKELLFHVEQEGDERRIFVDGDWPDTTLCTPEFVTSAQPGIVDATIKFTVANGTATYRIVDWDRTIEVITLKRVDE